MLFNSLQYILFLIAVVPLYWLVPRQLKNVLLLVASYAFYMSWIKGYGLLLLGLTAATYFCGLLIARVSKHSWKRVALIAGIAFNLGMLALFKYTNFLLDIVNQLGNSARHIFSLGTSPFTITDLPIILPLGISFFVFEFIHYLCDVFKGSKPVLSPVRFGLFAAFFPSQIAGPIKRYQDFDDQICSPRQFEYRLFESGCWLVLKGMFKKVALGDNLAPLVAHGFSHAQHLSTLDAWFTALAFTLQIYYDFSGYTDIGRGSAMLLGIKLPENFNFPYMAESIKEFWRRWHMTLSNWLRDYLYIPLGGSRTSSDVHTAKNLMITMLLAGLWHGAAWQYVIFGGIHGLALIANHYFGLLTKKVSIQQTSINAWLCRRLAQALTFLTVIVAFTMFRATSVEEGLYMYRGMFTLNSHGLDQTVIGQFSESTLPLALGLYLLVFMLMRYGVGRTQSHADAASPTGNPSVLSIKRLAPLGAARVITYAAVALLILGLAPASSVPFIYFQF